MRLMNIKKPKAIKKENVENILALSQMQNSMLFQYLGNNICDGKNIAQFCYKINMPLDISCFKNALQRVINQNEMLRTVFRWQHLEQPVQIILKKFDVPFEYIDISHINSSEIISYLEKFLHSERVTGFDLREQTYRFKLLHRTNSEYFFIVSCYNIVWDGWSNAIMLKEIKIAYDELINNTCPSLISKGSYKEFIQWLQRQDYNSAHVFWKEYLRNFSPISYFEKSSDNLSPKHLSYRFSLDDVLRKKISLFISNHNVTLATIFYTAWTIIMYQYNGCLDNVLGMTLSGRPDELPEIKDVMGLFINTLPLRTHLNPEEPILDVVKRIYNNIFKLEAYAYTPLSDVKTAAALPYEKSLFDTIVVVQNYPLDSMLVDCDEGLHMEICSMYDQTDFAIVVGITTYNGVTIDIRYDQKDFSQEKIRKLMKQFIDNISRIVEKDFCYVKDFTLPEKINRSNSSLELLKRMDFDEIF